MGWFGRRKTDNVQVTVGWAVQCCGEHLYSEQEVRSHEEQYHPKGESNVGNGMPDELQADPKWVAEVVAAAFRMEAALYQESLDTIERLKPATVAALTNLQKATRRNP